MTDGGVSAVLVSQDTENEELDVEELIESSRVLCLNTENSEIVESLTSQPPKTKKKKNETKRDEYES